MSGSIIGIRQLGPSPSPWQTDDPFLFCVHHFDRYPKGQLNFGPDRALLKGHQMGSDFEGKDGFRMYHGDEVPGFPQHPHRGFETVTIVRQGMIDHSDSLGAAARYGAGDVQWLTAGAGILHSEMFPLLKQAEENPAELFQIWLNLPAKNKMAPPHFSMFWKHQVPIQNIRDALGKETQLTVIAGAVDSLKPPPPPPHSWASQENSKVAIWTLRMQPDAEWTLPASVEGLNRTLYYFEGGGLMLEGEHIQAGHAIRVRSEAAIRIKNGGQDSQLLLLQGRPIGEPVMQYGPFVMSTREELQQAFLDYRRTEFGGWRWPSFEPVHGQQARFARQPDGSVETPP